MTENCSLVARLYAHAREAPLNSAIVTPSDTITYRELAQLVLAQAEVLYRKGIIESTSVGICCEDQVQHLIYSLALDHIGATSFSVPTYESRASQLAMLQQGNADVELDETFASDVLGSGTSHKLASLTQPALAIEDSHSRHDAALLFTTSGTSGKPKLVIHHSSDLVAQAHRHIQSPQERFACLANIQHNFAKRHRLYCVAMGACNVFIDNAPESIVNDCLRTGITALHVSAIQAQALLAAKETDKLSHICLKLGGSHVPLTLRAELRNRITQQLKAGYGTTETGAIAFTDPDDEQAGESVGQPLPGIEVQIVDTNKSPLGVGQQGEIAIRCKGMFRGYFKQEEQTQLRLQNGWFFTGDIGYLDDKQRIFVCGRRDDMFVFNSMNIYPQDIEAVLCQHPMVLDAAVVPKESANHGNIPVALVVPNTKSEASKQSIEQFSQDRLGSRCPRQFILVERIPRNSSGKISRKEAQIEAHKRPLTRDRLRQTLADVLSTTSRINIKPALLKAFEQSHKDIFIEDLTLDSLARMNLLVALEVNHGVLINFEELAQLDSLEQLVELALAADSECSQHKSSSMPFSARSIARSTNAAYAGAPYAVRLFWRLLRRCDSITAFNKASHLLKHRLTPAQCQELIEQHGRAELIPETLDQALKSAIIVWLQHFDILFQQAEKRHAETFVFKRLAPTAYYFTGQGSPSKKTLLLCFAGRGGRGCDIPNAAIMQHLDASRYDMLVISEPLDESYHLGVPFLGENIHELIHWLANHKTVQAYHSIRTLGFSAGGYPAILAAHRLKAELALSISSRFYRFKKHPAYFFERVFNFWRYARSGHHPKVRLTFANDSKRDRRSAKIIACLCRSELASLSFKEPQVHDVLVKVAARGELKAFLETYLLDTPLNDERENQIAAQKLA